MHRPRDHLNVPYLSVSWSSSLSLEDLTPNEKPAAAEVDAPKVNGAGVLTAVGALGLAPPNDRRGALPSGPNLPSLAGGSATGVVLDDANVLLSGVVG